MAGNDGLIHHSTDGGLTGKHPEPNQLILVAPATATELNSIILDLAPIACWSVGDIRFEFDSSFVKPQAAEELRNLAGLREDYKKPAGPPSSSGTPPSIYPPISIFGHADPVGDDNYNKQLSGRRATAIYALLTRNVHVWEDLYSNPFAGDNWNPRAIQSMLAELGFLNGPASGEMDEATRSATVDFQNANGLTADGDPGPRTRAVLFQQYMDRLCGTDFKLDPSDDFLGRGQDSGGKGDYQGCSEFNPVLVFSQSENEALNRPECKADRNAQNAPNRRVLVFLYRPGARVDPAKWPCPRVKESGAACHMRFWSDGEQRRSSQEQRRVYEDTRDTFACRFYDRMARRSPCERAVAVMRIRLHDCFGEKMPGVEYQLDYAGRQKSGRADAEGFLADTLDPDAERCSVRWDPAGSQSGGGPSFNFEMELFVQLPDLDSDEGVKRRLHNLGYPVDRETVRNLMAFQGHHNLDPTGEADDATKSKLRDIYADALDDHEPIQQANPPSVPPSEQRT
jgi:peptidoglycan hydrolase-like protein with peptidoglycan-binding domain